MKNIKRTLVMIMAIAFAFGAMTTAFAAEVTQQEQVTTVEEEVQPRIGYAAHYTFGFTGKKESQSYSFKTVAILFPSKKWTIKTTNFSNTAEIKCILLDDHYNPSCSGVELRGNQ